MRGHTLLQLWEELTNGWKLQIPCGLLNCSDNYHGVHLLTSYHSSASPQPWSPSPRTSVSPRVITGTYTSPTSCCKTCRPTTAAMRVSTSPTPFNRRIPSPSRSSPVSGGPAQGWAHRTQSLRTHVMYVQGWPRIFSGSLCLSYCLVQHLRLQKPCVKCSPMLSQYLYFSRNQSHILRASPILPQQAWALWGPHRSCKSSWS